MGSEKSSFKNIGQLPQCEDISLLNWIHSQFPVKTVSMYDYGCGYGTWTKQLSELGNFDAVNVFDPDIKAKENAILLLSQKFNENIDKFDFIMLFAVLELLSIEEQEEILIRLVDKMEDSSSRMMVMYNFYHPFNIRWLLFAILGNGSPTNYHNTKKFKRSYLNYSDFQVLLNKCGLEVVDWYSPSLYRGFGPSSKFINCKYVYSNIFLSLKKTVKG